MITGSGSEFLRRAPEIVPSPRSPSAPSVELTLRGASVLEEAHEQVDGVGDVAVLVVVAVRRVATGGQRSSREERAEEEDGIRQAELHRSSPGMSRAAAAPASRPRRGSVASTAFSAA